MKNLGILLSGRGSNFEAIADNIASGKLDANIAVVISNRADAPGVESARRRGLNALVIPSKGKQREEHDREVVAALREHEVDLVCLAGYMRLLSAWFVQQFPNRILNIHPALLPAFPGLDAQKQAFEYGVKVSGCTVHFVDESLDHGAIILQRVVPVLDSDDEHTLAARILEQEHVAYSEAIRIVLEGKYKVEGRRVLLRDKGQTKGQPEVTQRASAQFFHPCKQGQNQPEVRRGSLFVLGAGFSADAGFPLIAGLRERVLSFIASHRHPSWDVHIHPSKYFERGQFYAGLDHINSIAGPSLQFEELLQALYRHLETAVDQDPCFVTRRIIQDATAYLLWEVHTALQNPPAPYLNFARRVAAGCHQVLSFNWDLLAEFSLEREGIAWRYSPSGVTVPVFKPHGSINWSRHDEDGLQAESPRWIPISDGSGFSFIEDDPFNDPFAEGPNQDLRPLVLPGGLERHSRSLEYIWRSASECLADAPEVVFIGYSLPEYDQFAIEFFLQHLKGKTVRVCDPSGSVISRFRHYFGNSIVTCPTKFKDSPFAQRLEGGCG